MIREFGLDIRGYVRYFFQVMSGFFDNYFKYIGYFLYIVLVGILIIGKDFLNIIVNFKFIGNDL